MPEEPHATALSLWRALDVVDPRWTEPGARECPWLFRGQSDASWRLVPPAWRTEGDAAKAIQSAKDRWQQKHGPVADPWELQRFAQRLLLGEFASVARRDGCDLPPDTPQGDLGPDPSHEIVTLAQHFRLPTALLDFTRDPMVAMCWAIDDARADAGGNIAIWAVREGGWQAAAAYNHARSRNRNLLAQDGVTVESWIADHYYRARSRFPGLEECNGIPAESFRKLVLPHSQAPELRRLLEVRGVTRSRLTPGFYGVVQTVLARFLP